MSILCECGLKEAEHTDSHGRWMSCARARALLEGDEKKLHWEDLLLFLGMLFVLGVIVYIGTVGV